MKSPIDLSLYLVTNRGTLCHEDFFRIVRECIYGGVKLVQLREKEASVREMISLGRSLRSILNPLGVPLIINDRVDVAHAVNADGVHLGQEDLKVADARAILGKKTIIGLSVDTLEQAMGAADEDINYIAVGPIFHTRTKADCRQSWGLDGLRQVCSFSRLPVVAIGGIDEKNVEDVLECGVAGVAVVSAIFDAPCPGNAAIKITKRMEKHAI